MTESRYEGVQGGSLVNEYLAPLGDAEAAVTEAGAAHASRIARESAAYQSPSEAERAARERLQTAARRGAPPDAELDASVREAFGSHYRLRNLNADSLIPLDMNFDFPLTVSSVDVGMWWWGQTNWWVPTHLFGLTAFAQDGVRFRGQLNYDDGDLWFGSAGTTSIYGIGSDRLPPQGWYRSTPRVNLWGEVWGFTGVSGPFSFGDNWSKCWLHANQKIRIEGGATIAEAHWFDTLLFFESDGSHGVRGLPGTFNFPDVFVYVVPNRPLVVELELKFDIQLEGSSAFRFGNYGGWTEALFQAPQWSLVP
jgi:hypothetical protein